ncbi:Mitogen-activated protein kinase kinase kinase 1 isoform 1 [Hibiscus syriacus]|uniref:Mitogen-activated protein kinase kinase kinase 1 isoform 1 n=1 Tax=Hibiscus syriacus TaxID=106335 RepID=A0A6A2XI88_HIBSY|nr:Mitogen-activated protein kinase kinase kinase 1 isoform 1 [Hibiscus syriacus]
MSLMRYIAVAWPFSNATALNIGRFILLFVPPVVDYDSHLCYRFQFLKCQLYAAATAPQDPQQEGAQLVITDAAATSESTVSELQEESTEEGPSAPSTVSCEKQVLSRLVCFLCPEADPERQRNWRRLERQRDLGNLLSTLQSSFGEERADDSILPVDDGSWLTVFFLIRVFQPGSSPRSSSWSGTSGARAQLRIRGRLTRYWGEIYDGKTGPTRDEDNESSDGGSFPWRSRVR